MIEWYEWIINVDSNDILYDESGNLGLNSNYTVHVRDSMSILIGSGDIGDG